MISSLFLNVKVLKNEMYNICIKQNVSIISIISLMLQQKRIIAIKQLKVQKNKNLYEF